MGREYQKYLSEKYAVLKTEFDKINKNTEDGITLEELLEFLNSYEEETGKKYDMEYAKKLFDLIDLDHDEEITIQEFIMAYMILEEKLRIKKIKLQKLGDDLKSASEKYLNGMKENKDEIVNKEGIAKNAMLNISVIEAKGLKPLDYNGLSDPYCILHLDEQTQKTNYQPETLDPIWNEDFSL
jgi:Ca2+-binding EF-hand superfamily protein